MDADSLGSKEEATREEAVKAAPVFSSLFFKLAGTVMVFGVAPFLAVAFFVPSGYEAIIGKLASAIPNFSQDPQFASLRESMQTFYLQTRFTSGIIFVFITVGGLIASYLLVRPMNRLAHFVRNINWNDPATLVMPQSYDEVGELAQELRKGIQNFKRIRERDREISESKSDFLKIAAHQLRTPLTQIKWSLEGLQKTTREVDRQPYLEQTSHSVEQMIRLVGDLLDVVRIEENRFGYSFKKIDFALLLRTITHEFTMVAKERQVQLTLSLPHEPLPFPFVDENGITLVLNNLLSNALQYTQSGGSVTISALRDTKHNHLVISVRDTGIGVPKDERRRIFTQFFRASNAIRMQPNGSGIGLFIARTLVGRHGGTLKFDSIEGKGSTFTFTLPLSEKDIPKEEKDFKQFFEQLGPASVVV